MLIESERIERILRSRMNLIQQLTELNSRHIRSQTQLAGNELHLSRCREAMDRGDESEDFADAIAQYEREISEIEAARAAIDRDRDALNEELQALDSKIQQCN